MDEKQLQYEFMSILGESHPGLTFEEYRDSCVFLLFYQYLCLRYDDQLEESYQLGTMVKMAVRGKLQMASFLRFIEAASPFLYFASKRFRLTEFSFYIRLTRLKLLEKQKSYARFFRKLIKKMDTWNSEEVLLDNYAAFFHQLMVEFARMKKETYVSEDLLSIYRLFLSSAAARAKRVFLPEFSYGLLFEPLTGKNTNTELYGYEDREGFREIQEILCFMAEMDEKKVHLEKKEDWDAHEDYKGSFDAIALYMPEGVEAGTWIGEEKESGEILRLTGSISKGEFPFLLSALPYLKEDGVMAAVLPGALLYREGREAQIRKYIVDKLNCLDVVMLLPDHLFQSVGQKEVFFLFRNHREEKEIMFFDCSEMEKFGAEQLHTIALACQERKTIPGFCSCVKPEEMEKNEYNLNLPRYIMKSMKMTKIDLEAKKKRIAEIEQELEEIEKRIAMYKRDLELS